MEVTWEKNEYGEDVKITTLPNGAKVQRACIEGRNPADPSSLRRSSSKLWPC